MVMPFYETKLIIIEHWRAFKRAVKLGIVIEKGRLIREKTAASGRSCPVENQLAAQS